LLRISPAKRVKAIAPIRPDNDLPRENTNN